MNQQEYIANWMSRNAERGDQEISLDNVSLFVRRDVFSPDPTLTCSTTQVLRHFPNVAGKRVLDVGTGCGALAIIAASRAAKQIVAVDIDPAAVKNASENCRRAGLERVIKVIQGDLFETVEGKFDVILANLPILSSAWELNGVSVSNTFSRFFAGLDNHLAAEGRALFSFASFGDEESLRRTLQASSRQWRVLVEEKFGVIWQLYVTGPDNNSLNEIRVG